MSYLHNIRRIWPSSIFIYVTSQLKTIQISSDCMVPPNVLLCDPPSEITPLASCCNKNQTHDMSLQMCQASTHCIIINAPASKLYISTPTQDFSFKVPDMSLSRACVHNVSFHLFLHKHRPSKDRIWGNTFNRSTLFVLFMHTLGHTSIWRVSVDVIGDRNMSCEINKYK